MTAPRCRCFLLVGTAEGQMLVAVRRSSSRTLTSEGVSRANNREVWEVSVPLEGEYEPSPEYPPYVGYQRSTQREIPVFVLKPATSISR